MIRKVSVFGISSFVNPKRFKLFTPLCFHFMTTAYAVLFFEKWIFYRKKEVTSDNDYYDTKVNKDLLKSRKNSKCIER